MDDLQINNAENIKKALATRQEFANKIAQMECHRRKTALRGAAVFHQFYLSCTKVFLALDENLSPTYIYHFVGSLDFPITNTLKFRLENVTKNKVEIVYKKQ